MNPQLTPLPLGGVAGHRAPVTGGDGPIGSAVVQPLAEPGARVTVYPRAAGPEAAARAAAAGATAADRRRPSE